MDYIWILLIIYIAFLGIKVSKKINYKNFKLIELLKGLDKEGLFLSLGTKIGVGSIIGTAISIYIGGPGTLFWIWLFTFLTSSLIYAESYLGSKYKKKEKKQILSGPYFYTYFGLNNKILAIIITILLVLTYSHFFLMIQTNTVYEMLKINKYVIAIIMFIFLLLTLTLNIKNIINSLSKLVPIMCVIYLISGLYIIINNIELMPNIFLLIIKDAFTQKSIFTGAILGIKRCIFQEELLIGTTSISSGLNEMPSDKVANTQTIGAYFINFIVATITAILIIIYLNNGNNVDGSYNDLLISVYSYHLGNIGVLILILEIILFSVTTILSGFYIGTSIISYFSKNKIVIFIIKASMLIFSILGIFLDTKSIWLIIDIIMFIIIIFNSYIITKLKGEVYDK